MRSDGISAGRFGITARDLAWQETHHDIVRLPHQLQDPSHLRLSAAIRTETSSVGLDTT